MKKHFLIILPLVLLVMVTPLTAQWKQTNGPNCGTIKCLTNSSKKIFAGTRKGLYQSDDYGNNWSQVSALGDLNIYKMASVDSMVFIVAQSKFYISKNGGKNWTNYNFTPSGNVAGIAINDSCIFVGSDKGGVYKSIDKGASWTPANSGITDLSVRCIHTKGNTIFVSTISDGTFWSKNNGRSWMPLDLDPKTTSKSYVFSFFNDGANIYAGTDNEIFLSSDNGATWIKSNFNYLRNSTSNFARAGNSIYAGGYSGIFKSANNGIDWTLSTIKGDVSLRDNNRLVGIEDKIFIGNGGRGVFMYEEIGKTLNSVNNGLKAGEIRDIENLGSTIFAIQEFAGIYYSTDNGISWKSAHTGLDVDLMVYDLAIKDNTLYAATLSGIYKSVNNGANWTEISSGLIDLHAIQIAITNNNIFALDFSGNIYQLSLNGTSWTPIQINTPINLPVYLGTNGNNIFAITKNDGIFLSTDNCKNWIGRNNGITTKNINDIAFNANSLFISTDLGVFKSANNGDSWTAVNSGLKYLETYDLATNGNNIFVADVFGNVQLSTNNGESWNSFHWGMSNNNDVRKLVVIGDFIFAGTDGNSIWKRPLSETTGIKTVITDYKLNVYPNPANEMITIETGRIHNASLSIYNSEGKVMTKIEHPGTTINVDIRNFPEGIYLVNLKDGSIESTFRFIKQN